MSTETSSLLEAGSPDCRPTHTGGAFGLAVESDFEVEGLVSAATAGGHRTALKMVEMHALEPVWRRANPIRLHEWSLNQETVLTMDGSRQLGYRLSAEALGTYVVSLDGTEILVATPRGTASAWQRLLVARVLPLAAALQGLELLHSSAVCINGKALAIAGSSGAGKTTIACALMSRGASFLTDDVLAIAPAADGVLAYPGIGVLNVDAQQERMLGGVEYTPLESADKRRLDVGVERRAHRLEALCLITRQADADAVRARYVAEPSPRSLLGNVFMRLLGNPERVGKALETHVHLARTTATWELTVPENASPEEVAGLVEESCLRGHE